MIISGHSFTIGQHLFFKSVYLATNILYLMLEHYLKNYLPPKKFAQSPSPPNVDLCSSFEAKEKYETFGSYNLLLHQFPLISLPSVSTFMKILTPPPIQTKGKDLNPLPCALCGPTVWYVHWTFHSKLTTMCFICAVGSRGVSVVSAGCTGGATVHVLVACEGAGETFGAI